MSLFEQSKHNYAQFFNSNKPGRTNFNDNGEFEYRVEINTFSPEEVRLLARITPPRGELEVLHLRSDGGAAPCGWWVLRPKSDGVYHSNVMGKPGWATPEC